VGILWSSDIARGLNRRHLDARKDRLSDELQRRANHLLVVAARLMPKWRVDLRQTRLPSALPMTGLPARVISGTFPSPAHAEGHWLAASGAIKIYCAIDSSKYCMARQAYCIFWQN